MDSRGEISTRGIIFENNYEAEKYENICEFSN
jgi:hypothetical protein